jgi:hypothetical protein
MPQGLPKKIEVGLLLADLALELRDPTPRRRSLIEERTLQRRAGQAALARTAWTAQRFQPALPNLLLPLVYTAPVDLESGGYCRHIFPRRDTAHCRSLQLYRDPLCSLHQFLS